MSKNFYGIDFGGSSLKAVCVDEQGNVVRSAVASAGGLITREELIGVSRQTLQQVAAGETVNHVGLAFGGAIRGDGTMQLGSTNLPNIAGTQLVPFFEQELVASVRIENDARAAMRGEAWSGSARGLKNAMTITFGTGIGSGIMLEGELREGSHGTAGEIGIWTLDEGVITFEDACAPGRVERATGKRFDEMFSRDQANGILSRTGRAIANAHLLLDLEAVVLLGGITELGEPLRSAIEASFKAACPPDYWGQFSVRLGHHGELAGAVGAASLWQRNAA